MTEPRFQAGDRVEALEGLPGIRQGGIYTVTQVDGPSIWFRDDDGDGRVRPASGYRLSGRDLPEAPIVEEPVTEAVLVRHWASWA